MWSWAMKLERRLSNAVGGNEEGEIDTTYEMEAKRSLRKWGRVQEERSEEMHRKRNRNKLSKNDIMKPKCVHAK